MTKIRKGLNKVDSLLAKHIKMMRVTVGMTQTNFGKIINVSAQQIQKIEQGKNRISSGNLFLLCEHFNINIHELFTSIISELPDEITKDNDHGCIELSEMRCLAKAFMKIEDKKMRDTIISFVHDLNKTQE